MKFKRSSRVLFVDPSVDTVFSLDKGEKVDLILSPSLYWVKKITIPVKSVREVKKLLPSIFLDSLPEGHYSYSAYKKEDDFIAFAYEDKKILALLAQKGIGLSSIHSIHFAQSEFETLEGALEINEMESIYLKDDLVVVVPTVWLKESEPLVLEDKKLSKHTIKLQQFGHIVDNKSFYMIGTILSIFIFILIVEIFLTHSKIDTIANAKDSLFSKYKLQSTMFQNRSTFTKYNNIHTLQTELRAVISYFLSMPLRATQKITLIEYKEKKLMVTISGVIKGQERGIISRLNAKKVKYKLSFSGQNMKVEVKL